MIRRVYYLTRAEVQQALIEYVLRYEAEYIPGSPKLQVSTDPYGSWSVSAIWPEEEEEEEEDEA